MPKRIFILFLLLLTVFSCESKIASPQIDETANVNEGLAALPFTATVTSSENSSSVNKEVGIMDESDYNIIIVHRSTTKYLFNHYKTSGSLKYYKGIFWWNGNEWSAVATYQTSNNTFSIRSSFNDLLSTLKVYDGNKLSGFTSHNWNNDVWMGGNLNHTITKGSL